MKKFRLMFVLTIIALITTVTVVHAPWSTLGTGYAITSNYHGIDVPLGTPVTVTAGTLDSNIVQVTFRWHRPPNGNGPVAWEDVVPVWQNGTMGQWNNGSWSLISYAQNTHNIDEMGDWGVQAFFQDSHGKEKSGLENVVKIKATSFNAIPEVPLGTIAVVLAMIGALGIFAIKKKPRLAFSAKNPS